MKVTKVTQSEKTFTPSLTQPRRMRRIDIYMAAATVDVKDGDMGIFEVEDDDDQFLDEISVERKAKNVGVLHVPYFYCPLIESDNSKENKHRKLMDSNFITDDLSEEIETLYPEVNDTVTRSGITYQKSQPIFQKIVHSCFQKDIHFLTTNSYFKR